MAKLSLTPAEAGVIVLLGSLRDTGAALSVTRGEGDAFDLKLSYEGILEKLDLPDERPVGLEETFATPDLLPDVDIDALENLASQGFTRINERGCLELTDDGLLVFEALHAKAAEGSDPYNNGRTPAPRLERPETPYDLSPEAVKERGRRLHEWLRSET